MEHPQTPIRRYRVALQDDAHVPKSHRSHSHHVLPTMGKSHGSVSNKGMQADFGPQTGINAILYYAPQIFEKLGLSNNTTSLLATGVVGIAMVIYHLRID